MFNKYKDSKEYLDKQQKIDLLLVLANLLQAPATSEENQKLINKKITSILEDIK